MIRKITLAGHALRYKFNYPYTEYYFSRFAEPCEGEEYEVCASPDRIERTRRLLPESAMDHNVEYRSLMEPASLALLPYGCCLYHAVSFVYKGYAWLLTAPSGVGKTTQYLNWQRLFPGEIRMISGDMPVLCAMEDGSVTVHPSPWNGKEKIGNADLSGTLAGIVVLEQGGANAIEDMPAGDAVKLLFKRFVVRPETEEQILALAKLMDVLYRAVPVLRFTNLGDEASTLMLRAALDGLIGGNRRDL